MTLKIECSQELKEYKKILTKWKISHVLIILQKIYNRFAFFKELDKLKVKVLFNYV